VQQISTFALTWGTTVAFRSNSVADAGAVSVVLIAGNCTTWHSQNASWITTTRHAPHCQVVVAVNALVALSSLYIGSAVGTKSTHAIARDLVADASRHRTRRVAVTLDAAVHRVSAKTKHASKMNTPLQHHY
jgi:hypothetical protein